jgi:hypothetical protein
MNQGTQQPLFPAGAMLELSLALISEGKLAAQIDEAIKQAHSALLGYREATGDPTGKAGVNIKIELKHDKDMQDVVVITHGVSVDYPKRTDSSFAKEKNGRLLVQPIGSTQDSPDQQVIFDSRGRSIGVIEGGEFKPRLEEPAVAGKIAGNA